MKGNMLVGVWLLMLAATPAVGAESLSDNTGMHDESGDLYRSNELSVDVFGTASLGKYTINHWSGRRIRHDARLGGGMGYRFTPQVSAFIDAPWVLPEETKYFGVARLGARFAF